MPGPDLLVQPKSNCSTCSRGRPAVARPARPRRQTPAPSREPAALLLRAWPPRAAARRPLPGSGRSGSAAFTPYAADASSNARTLGGYPGCWTRLPTSRDYRTRARALLRPGLRRRSCWMPGVKQLPTGLSRPVPRYIAVLTATCLARLIYNACSAGCLRPGDHPGQAGAIKYRRKLGLDPYARCSPPYAKPPGRST